MKTGAKIALGAGVITAGLAAAGSIYVHDTLIPQQLAGDLNRELTAMAPGQGAQASVTADGAITITRNGLFSYTANVPQLTVAADLGEGITKRTVIAPAAYALGLSDPFNAAILAAVPKTQISPSHVLITNDAPVTFTQDFTLQISEGEVHTLATVQGACATVSLDSFAEGNVNSAALKLQDCALTGTASDGVTDVAVAATLDLDYKAHMNENGVHTDSADITLRDVNLTSTEFEGGAVTIERIALGLSYDGLSPEKLAAAAQTGALAAGDLPNDLSLAAAVTNIRFLAHGQPVMPPLSAEGSLELKGLQGDAASVTFRYQHLLDQFADFGMVRETNQPTRSDCTVGLANIPVRTLLDIFNAANETTPPDLAQIESTVEQAGTSLSINCSAGNDFNFATSVKADHKAEGGGFPGAGKLELYGVEQVLGQAIMLFGPDAYMMGMMALQLAQPTPDGNGAQWEYTMDKNGILAINGQIVGGTRNMMGPRR